MYFPSWISMLRQSPKRRNILRKRATFLPASQQLEVRVLLTAYAVTNLNDAGSGSLRQAIQNANSHIGADTINFDVTGVIKLTSGALSTITDTVDIRGNSAPGFSTKPVVEVNFNGFAGLQFSPGAGNSALRSLALDNAGGAGVKITGGASTLIVGNYIGLGLDGTTVFGNSGDGLALEGAVADRITSNVISGNGGNGISVSGSVANHFESNSIGTDFSGTLDRGNAQNGILITNSSVGNLIGGTQSGGNNPTQGTFVRPPLGNLISGNNANGVLITGHSVSNTLSGNFIGTAALGNSALGNTLDGVAIVNADGNTLSGCTITDNPFVYYNVVSGNGANGLRVTNSNNTTIQANFFGLGANNQTAVGNGLNGVLVEGNSAGTLMGGPIPLGNVVAANGANGIVVQDTASGFVSYNTFCGLAAFQTYTNLGNHLNGMLITSTGGGIVIRTNVITENGNDGIQIAGLAHGVIVDENIIGLDTNGQMAMGNKANGVEVTASAHDIDIGGPTRFFSIIPQNTISANLGSGVAITGSAYNVHVNFSYIGTNITGTVGLGNVGPGVYIGASTHSNTIGSADPSLRTIISGNGNDGIQMVGTTDNQVIDCMIGVTRASTALGNARNGISITNSSNNSIGGYGTLADVIAFNGANGVYVVSGSGNSIRGNSIYSNTLLGIDLAAGANTNQAAPVLSSVQTVGGLVLVSGSLTSKPNTTFTIELFANLTSAPSGRIFLGSVCVRTNGAGVGTFTYIGLRPTAGYNFFTATATDPQNNTSEFSAPRS